MPASRQSSRPARDRNPQPNAAAALPRDGRVLKGKLHVVGNEQVQKPIPVIVHEAATGAPVLLLTPQARLPGHICKGTIAVIAVENVLPKAGAENIVKVVVVIITYTNAARPSKRMQSGFFSNVCESAISIVFVKTIGCALRCAFKARARQNKNVHPSIVVVVNECAATTSRLDKIFLLVCLAVDDRRTQPGMLRNIYEASMEGATGRRGSG